MLFVTDFADQAVVLPLVLATAIAFWGAGWRRGAIAWALIMPATLAVVALAKLLVFAYGPPAFLATLASPSGHTASAALVYGALLGLPFAGPARILLAALPVAAGIGASRILLGVHSGADVFAGAVIGLAGAIAFAVLAGPKPALATLRRPAAALLLIVILCHGHRLPAEPWLRAHADALMD